MQRKRKTILAVLLTAVMLLGVTAPALAATTAYNTTIATGYVQAKEAVNIRSGPGTSYSRLGWLESGAIVVRTGTSGNWTQISLGNGSYGFVSSTYLRTVTNVSSSLVGKGMVLQASGGGSTTTGDQYYATGSLNLRTGPGTSYARIGQLAKGDKVTVTSVSNNWAKVIWNGTQCYASFKYLAPVSSGSGFGSTTPATGTQYYATTALNLRSGPSTSYARIGWLEKGESVTLISVTGSWAKVNWKGTACYAFFSYLKQGTGSTPAPTPTITYNVTVAAVTAYYGPGTYYATAGTLAKGARIECLGTVGTWTLITWNNTVAYIPTSYVTTATSTTPTPGVTVAGTYTVTQNAAVYRGPGTNYASAGTLLKGVVVQVVSATNGWALLNLNGEALYVQSSYLLLQSASSGTGGTGSGSGRWQVALDSADATLADFVKANRSVTGYGFTNLKTIYVVDPPRGFSFISSDYSFSGARTMNVTFRDDDSSDKAYFTWYRSPSACPDNYLYWSRFASGGIYYYFAEHQTLGYSEAYWVRYGELFYARVPYSFTQSDAIYFFSSLHKVSAE